MRARARVKWAADNSPAAGLELPIVLVVAELGLLIAPVAGLGLPIVPVAVKLALPIVLAAELATQEPIDLAAAGLAPSQPLAQPVGVAETALAIDKFPELPVAEATMRSAELRVEIEVQRWPATTGVPPAWELPAAAVVPGAAAGAGGKQAIDKGEPMRSKSDIMSSSKICLTVSAIFLSCFLGLAVYAAPKAKSDAAASSQAKQKGFDTPKQAADDLIQAAELFDVPALKDILGPDGEDLITSEDVVLDKNRAIAFAAKAKEKNSIEVDKKNPNRATLSVGNEDWPVPIPIVKRKGKWYFDSKAGRDEILLRRIGENELDAIEICRGFVEAQDEYAEQKHDDSKVNQYAQRVISTSGKQDGLAWQNPDGTWGGPVGEGIAKALAQGYTDKTQPYHGYYFKILKGQGPAAPLGQMDFVVGGAMIGGFALAATPAQYRVTGVKTFIVSHDGVVYEKDLGPDSLKVFKSMERFNPDKTWHPTDDQW